MTAAPLAPFHFFWPSLIALIAVFYHLLPQLTRPEIYFAVTMKDSRIVRTTRLCYPFAPGLTCPAASGFR